MYRLLLFLLAAAAPTVDEIVARSIAAMGGADQFATVQSIKVHGRLRFGQEADTPFVVIAQRPAKFRMEFDAGPDHIVQAYDGVTGWQSVSGQHDQAPKALSGENLAHLADQAANAIGGPLLDLVERKNHATYAGREAVDGVDCYKLRVTLATGDSIVVFVDPASFLTVMEELPVQINGEPATIQQLVGNYRRFGPTLIACLYVTRQKGGADSQRMEIDSVEMNPQIADTIFKR